MNGLPLIASSSMTSKHHTKILSHGLYKTFRQFKHKKNQLSEQDSVCVSSMYCDPNDTNDLFNKKIFRETSLKYNIGEKLKHKEEDEISHYLKHNKKRDGNITYHIPTQIHFSSPFKSKKVLKVNAQIYHRIMKIRYDNQCESYANKILMKTAEMDTINRMPKVRVSKAMKHFDLINSITNDEGSVICHTLPNEKSNLIQPINTETNKAQVNIRKYHPRIPRDKMLTSLMIEEDTINIPYHPPARSQLSVCLTDENICFIFGGILGERLDDLWYCDMKQSKLKWTKIDIIEDDTPIPRYGQTMTFWQEKLYIYGGNIKKNYWKPREEMAVFSIDKMEYSYPTVVNKNLVTSRRNHIGISVGQNLLIHGGIDENDVLLNDMWIYDYPKSKYYNVSTKGMPLPYVAFHSALLISDVTKANSQMFSIYRVPDGTKGSKGTMMRIKMEGVYVFGGLDSGKRCSQKLWIIRIGRKPLEIFEPKTYGKPPLPRKSCIIALMGNLNLLAIHGGKNEQYAPEYMNNTTLLDLETMNWIHPLPNINEPTYIAEHAGFSYRNKIFILGGLGPSGFAKFDFFTLEAVFADVDN